MRSWLLILVACSTPAPAPKPDPLFVAPPPRPDAAAAVEQAPRPDAAIAWTWDWPKHRKEYDDLMATPPREHSCDWRVRERYVEGVSPECHPPDLPHWHAAKITRVHLARDGAATSIQLDIGTRDRLTERWHGAVLDDDGRRLTPWVHPESIQDRRSYLTVSTPIAELRGKKRVVLFKKVPAEAADE